MPSEGKGDPGNGATVEEVEHYLLELLGEADPYGEAAFVREEVVRRIARLRYTVCTLDHAAIGGNGEAACRWMIVPSARIGRTLSSSRSESLRASLCSWGRRSYERHCYRK
jgi:hypothetical protein